MKKEHETLTEALHLVRKHAIKTKRFGLATLAKCEECGRNGADRPDRIKHEVNCRLALLMQGEGYKVRFLKPGEEVGEGKKFEPKEFTEKVVKKMVEAPSLDECTS